MSSFEPITTEGKRLFLVSVAKLKGWVKSHVSHTGPQVMRLIASVLQSCRFINKLFKML